MIINADCLEQLDKMEENSVDSTGKTITGSVMHWSEELQRAHYLCICS